MRPASPINLFIIEKRLETEGTVKVVKYSLYSIVIRVNKIRGREERVKIKEKLVVSRDRVRKGLTTKVSNN